jgi:hypothetical protein
LDRIVSRMIFATPGLGNQRVNTRYMCNHA